MPFTYLVNEAERNRVLQLTNRDVVLQAAFFPLGVSRAVVVESDSATLPEMRSEILSLRSTPPLNHTPKEPFGSYWASSENLVPVRHQILWRQGGILRAAATHHPIKRACRHRYLLRPVGRVYGSDDSRR